MAVGLLLASPGAAEACFTYCDWDPLVLVVTPSGHIVPVYDSVWTNSVLDLRVPLESYTAKRVYTSSGRPATAVDMTITTPTGLLFRYSYLAQATTGLLGSGTVLAYSYATWGAPTQLAAGPGASPKRENPPLGPVSLSIFFNAAQLYLSAWAAGLVLVAAGVSARGGINSGQDAVAVIAAAAAFYVTNHFLVATAVGLATSRHPLAIVRTAQKVVLAQFAFLYVIGAIAAYAAARWPLLPVLAVLPAVLAYHSLRQRIEIRRDAMRAMERMADEDDRRDPYTYQHSQRVAIYAHAIARKLSSSGPEVYVVDLAAKVHDIGKIRVPDSILLKPGKLTPDEQRVMETHPRLGFDILRPFSEYAKVLDLVLTHHERFDGLGYPNGTVGRRLLLMAQVIPVADSLDAMTSARAYRSARSWESAMEELRRGAGTQWNPQVVEAAVAVLAQEDRGVARRPSPTAAND